MPAYDALDLDLCESLYTAGGESDPFLSYDHNATVTPGDGCVHPSFSSAVSGLAFERGASFPDVYDGALFFADIQRSCIWAIPDANGDGSPDPSRLGRFVGQATYPVDVQFGPGGALYYVDLFNGALRRVRWTGPTAVARATPATGTAPLRVELDAGESSDPERGLRRALLRLGPRRRRRLRRLVRGDADPRVRAARQLSRSASGQRSRRAHGPRLGRRRGRAGPLPRAERDDHRHRRQRAADRHPGPGRDRSRGGQRQDQGGRRARQRLRRRRRGSRPRWWRARPARGQQGARPAARRRRQGQDHRRSRPRSLRRRRRARQGLRLRLSSSVPAR